MRCGIVQFRIDYPISKIRSIIHNNIYTHWGIVREDIITVFHLDTGILTPSIYKFKVHMDKMINDKFTTEYKFYELTNSSDILSLQQLYDTIHISKKELQQILLDSLKPYTILEKDYMNSLMHCYSSNIPFELISGNNYSKFKEPVIHAIQHINDEMAASLFLYSNAIKNVFDTVIYLLKNSDEFRELLTNHLFVSNDRDIITKLIQHLHETDDNTNMLIKHLNTSFITGYSNIKELESIFNNIKITNQTIATKTGVFLSEPNYTNLRKATTISLLNQTSDKNNHITLLYEIFKGIQRDCQDNKEQIDIPLNNIIDIINDLKRSINDTEIIPKISGSYHALLTPNVNTIKLITIPEINRKVLSTGNSDVSSMTTDELYILMDYIIKTNDYELLPLYQKAASALTLR